VDNLLVKTYSYGRFPVRTQEIFPLRGRLEERERDGERGTKGEWEGEERERVGLADLIILLYIYTYCCSGSSGLGK